MEASRGHGSESENRRFSETAEVCGTPAESLQVVWATACIHAKVRFVPNLLPAARFDGETAGGQEGELVKDAGTVEWDVESDDGQ